ncbi:MAG: NAD(+)/NADH kinase [Lachnospiraceae bacterium]|nr:NAD(+)/NADH kinase [Lachnospiraceae bacterium]
MNSFYIITNSIKDQDLSVTNKVKEYLCSHGKQCFVHATNSNSTGSYTREEHVPDHVECVIVLGGDGTLIQAARDMVNRDIPFLGINLGTLGFLADVEKDTLLDSLDRLMEGKYEIEERMMLKGRVTTQSKKTEAIALNDIVINRYGSLRIMEYNIYVNGKYLNTYRADGIIVSTPTGSTGYSLSAGGPIIEPKARMMVITPICPHTLNTRSVVLSDDDVICIETRESGQRKDDMAEVTFDGTANVRLVPSDFVEISKSEKTTKIMRINEESFLTVLSKKFKD